MRSSIKFVLFSLFVSLFVAIGCSSTVPTQNDHHSGSPTVVEKTGTVSQALTTINWSGRTWNVKNGAGLGPGPNYWSDSTSSVWVDGTGSLNLKIRKSGGKWYCAEVWLPESLGYGTYDYFIKTQADDIDRWVVQGFFLYEDDSHEYDMEWSLWGNASNPYNGGFAVQPYYISGNQYQFNQDIVNTNWHKVRIIWEPAQVTFQVETDSVVVQEWVYTGANLFAPGAELNHINNWLFQGHAPANGAANTLTLVSFTYTPLP
jgi:hypothetical protein